VKRVVPVRRKRKEKMPRRHAPKHYLWPEIQLNIWILIVLAASCVCLGIFAWFISVQAELNLGIPWYVISSYHLVLVNKLN
jgi:protein-S-isoprenylcysteine O-methyltransferase Ste14